MDTPSPHLQNSEMKNKIVCSLLVAVGLIVSHQTQAAAILVGNPSFESGISSWSGDISTSDVTTITPHTPIAATDGVSVAWINATQGVGTKAFYQQISSSILAGNIYTLTFDLGNRGDADAALGVLGADSTNTIQAYFAAGSTFNTSTLLGTAYSAPLSAVADGTWSTNLTSSFNSSSLGDLNQNLFVVFKSSQSASTSLTSQSIFDNIRVDAVPEPSRSLLALAGVAAIGLRRRRSPSHT